MSRKGRRIDKDLSPKLVEGLTEGPHALEEANERFPVTGGAVDLSYMRASEPDPRSPLPRFRAEEDTDSVWLDEATGRVQKNVSIVFTPEALNSIKSGTMCLRCLEPQSRAFPEMCESNSWSGCAYPIKERQILDLAMEMEGEKHLGPAKPISEYMQKQEERSEKLRWAAARAERGAGVSTDFLQELYRDASEN